MQWQEFRTAVRHLHAKDLLRIEQAFALGKKMHGDQKRKSGETYFSHPVAVATVLAGMGADADTIIAALLHDTVEDTSLTLPEIDDQFNGSVRTLIDGVTKLQEEDVAHSPKLNEQMESLRKMFTLMNEDIRIMVIKLVDRLHNMQTIEFLSPERQETMAHETSDVYAKIADRLCMQDLRDELDALCLAVLEPEMYKRVTAMREKNEQRGMKTIEEIRNQMRSHDPVLASRTQLSFEFKTWTHLRSQVDMGGVLAKGSTTMTIAFVCDDADTCYRILGALHHVWKREVLSFQDFINAPQLNGYEGVHTTLLFPDGSRIRCKIRTREMHQYARKGIATRCFDSKAEGIDTYLPWTKRISDLASDTEGSSDDFWHSLQSDILGESIVIHGPDDLTAQVPKDATALDGAFYLLQENALKTKAIMMNGIEAGFNTRLVNAASIDVVLHSTITCTLDWLQDVNTGFASALIRTTLSKQSQEKKIEVGKKLLQRTFSEHKRGFIEEFKEEVFLSQVSSLGFVTLNEIFIAIADGRTDANTIYKTFFELKEKKAHNSILPEYIVSYRANMDSLDVMDRLNAIHRMNAKELSEILYKRQQSRKAKIKLRIRATSSRLLTLRAILETAGATDVSVEPMTSLSSIIIATAVVLLWGLDAVFTKYILNTGVSPLSFTLIRSWSCVGIALIIFLMIQQRDRTMRIPIFHPLLWLSGISFFFVNLLTNYTLSEVTPFFYKTALRISIPLLAVHFIRKERHDWKIITSIFLFSLGILSLFLVQTEIQGIILALTMAGIFVLYTKSSALFQESAHIGIRYPQYFLAISSIAALLSLGLFAIVKVTWPTPLMLGAIICFTGLFVCLPYILYYSLQQTLGYYKLSPYFNLSIVITFIAQWIFLGIFDGIVILPCLIFIAASSLISKENTQNKNFLR